jgi:hypothetical protein
LKYVGSYLGFGLVGGAVSNVAANTLYAAEAAPYLLGMGGEKGLA